MSLTVWTIGHSTRAAAEFLELLGAHRVEAVADVRRFPGSRRHPHFGRDQLEPLLESHGIRYAWMPELGGRRTPAKDSRNTGWRVAAFRGYADYMETPEFEAAMSTLLQMAAERRTAVMCAESLWWQCHRRLISDWLVARKHDVVHIESATRSSPHRLIEPAKMVGGRLNYGADQTDLDV
ncbi:MAG TPA: DUF488 domain-containing protein [Gemmatimonadaceae bacterium]|nr:DUF488 domain-containing protein [Gemmatimonadaceae bacterium]